MPGLASAGRSRRACRAPPRRQPLTGRRAPDPCDPTTSGSAPQALRVTARAGGQSSGAVSIGRSGATSAAALAAAVRAGSRSLLRRVETVSVSAACEGRILGRVPGADTIRRGALRSANAGAAGQKSRREVRRTRCCPTFPLPASRSADRTAYVLGGWPLTWSFARKHLRPTKGDLSPLSGFAVAD
jgi:hypothetical protein